MPTLVHHKTGLNDINDYIDVRTADEPGSGGGHHLYILSSEKCEEDGVVTFHNPDPNRHGVLTGFTIEAYLSILLHRLECFQDGPFACEENKVALLHGRGMMEALRQRSARRSAAGIEGKQEEQPQKQAAEQNVLRRGDLALMVAKPNGVTAIPFERLATWGNWSELESVIKQSKRKLTVADVALLEELSQTSEGATRGWNELKQALTQANLLG